MSDATISTAKVSVGAEVESAGTGDSMTAAEAIVHEVKVANPLKVPYRTGSYLIYDEGSTGHFRSANALTEHPYRASGSHQLDFGEFVRVLGKVVQQYAPSTIYLVDLREETHGFFDLFDGTKRFGVAVSWYADNDFANVGQPLPWIVADEACRLAATEKGRTTHVFSIEPDTADDRAQGRVTPTRYEEVSVDNAYTEGEMVAQKLKFKDTNVEYVRIPVTDHCAPSDTALGELRKLRGKAKNDPKSWVHFHCHGGDGRTTTFLALYDMLCWKESPDPLPSVEAFTCRQCQLFSYCLDPSGCRNPDGSACGKCESHPLVELWKNSLAEVRWGVIKSFLQNLGG